MSTNLYSIITPVFNRVKVLQQFYDSIHSDIDIKILLLDNGSTDGTSELIKQMSSDPRVIVTNDPFNKGAAYARNCGLDFAFKDLKCAGVFFIDSDVVLGEDCLDRLVDYQAETGADIVFSNDQKREGVLYEEFVKNDFKASYKRKLLWTTECCYIPYTAFKKVGYFDEMFFPVYFEDPDYFYRLKLAGGKLMRAPNAHHYHFGGDVFGKDDEFSNFVKDRFRVLEEYYKYKWGGEPYHEKYKKPFNSDWPGYIRK